MLITMMINAVIDHIQFFLIELLQITQHVLSRVIGAGMRVIVGIRFPVNIGQQIVKNTGNFGQLCNFAGIPALKSEQSRHTHAVKMHVSATLCFRIGNGFDDWINHISGGDPSNIAPYFNAAVVSFWMTSWAPPSTMEVAETRVSFAFCWNSGIFSAPQLHIVERTLLSVRATLSFRRPA